MKKDDNKQFPKPEKILYDHHESSKEIAERLLPKHHPELASARFQYLCRSKAAKAGGKLVPGKVYKPAGWAKFLTETDFVLEIALDCWNNLEPNQRTALVDHLLSRCVGIEDDQTGEMKWKIRPPEVQEFPEVTDRHGAWNDSLTGMARTFIKRSV